MLQEVKLLERIELACEEQLAATFENYCSLAEDSPSGLAENGAPTPEQPAPALRPAVGLCSKLCLPLMLLEWVYPLKQCMLPPSMFWAAYTALNAALRLLPCRIHASCLQTSPSM